MAAEAASGGGVVKHILLAKFKDEVTPERLDQLIRGYAALVNVVPSMKVFHWYTHTRMPRASPYWLTATIALPSLSMLLCTVLCRGTDVSIENMHQGFTHVFETTFESTEGIKEYIEHPEHVKFANEFLPALEKTLIIDYKPTAVN
ncbi:hypothetical protein PR202_gb20635 [Eleusine coracana subsp. coracana]|uniref:Stress-response A/B barrel domain-containing protein n=1 Tax=Eleusine coracana subsp. coracana TaxID=191504 RepID=A0AAV5FCR3_ELECO|nr:hypothetical protein PR202_gb20635 [Eleusine coracana subsp. coracana]